MSRAWVTDRWLKKDASSSAKRSLNAAKNPKRANVPEQYRTSVYGVGCRWRVDYFAYGDDGRQHRRSKLFPTQTEADEYRDAVSDDLRSGRYRDASKQSRTFRQAAEEYLKSKHKIKESTLYRYRNELRMYVYPRWGDVPLSAITEQDINAWISALQDGSAAHDFIDASKPRKLAASSIHSIVKVTFGSVLRYAAASKRNWIRSNPLEDVDTPKKQQTEERVYLSYEEVESLADAAQAKAGESSAILIRFLAYTGMRIGEATALKVSDMDFDNRRATIARTWTKDKNGADITGSPKTWEQRKVAIPEFLLPDLQKLTEGVSDESFLFRPKKGDHVNIPNWRNRVFNPAKAGAGLDDLSGLTPHSLRHTYASLAIKAGADVKSVQNQLGHKDASMTLNVYAGLWPDRLDEVADALQSSRQQVMKNSRA